MIRKFFSWGAVLLLAIPYLDKDHSDYIYLVILCIILLLYVFKGHSSRRIPYREDSYPAIFFSVWFYGVIVGLLRNNPNEYVFRNFAGMVIYLIYYPLKQNGRIDKQIVWSVVYRASIIATIEIILCVFLHRTGRAVPWPLSNIQYGTSKLGINMTGCVLLPYVLFADSFYMLFRGQTFSRIKHFLLLVLSSIACIGFANQSAGILAYFLLAAVLMIIVMRSENKSKRTVLLVFLALGAVVITSTVFELSTGELSAIFSSEDGGNLKRFAQITLVANRFKFLGNGLGSVFDNYYLGFGGTYAIEISYLNLLDKCGVFALPLFWIYIQTIVKTIRIARQYFMSNAGRYAVTALGLCAFLVNSLGNPSLFSPYNVTLHVLSIYLCLEFDTGLKRMNNEKRKIRFIHRSRIQTPDSLIHIAAKNI